MEAKIKADETRQTLSTSSSSTSYVTSPISTIRGVFDSMLYIHTLACSISESLHRVTTRKLFNNDDDSLAGRTPPDDKTLSVSSSSSSEGGFTFSFSDGEKRTSFIFQGTEGNCRSGDGGFDDEGSDREKKKFGSTVVVMFEDLLINKNPVLQMLPESFSSRLIALFESARSGQLAVKPQAAVLVANITECIETIKQRFLPRYYYQSTAMHGIPRAPSNVGLTGLVLQYDVVDSQSKSLARYMHYDIDRRPFLATVSIPTTRAESRIVERRARRTSAGDDDEEFEICTPQSFPPSPYAREALMNDFTSFTNGILHAACDRLKSEGADSEADCGYTKIDSQDSHGDLVVDSSGLHVSKRRPDNRFRSCRTDCSLTRQHHDIGTKEGESKGRIVPVFFEFVISELMPEFEEGKKSPSSSACRIGAVCVGFSTKRMPLNSLVGSVHDSIGIHSNGTLLINGKRWNIGGDSAFGGSAVVGILAYVDDAGRLKTAFYLNGRLVAKPSPVPFDRDVELYPTITIISPSVSVTCNFEDGEFLYPPRNCRYRELYNGEGPIRTNGEGPN